jgi:cell division protein FtsI (penicillin-binding protein 3)
MVKNKPGLAAFFSRTLGGSRSAYLNILNQSKRFDWVKKDVTEEQRQTLMSRKDPAFIFFEERKRNYPYKDLAVAMLGLTNAEHHGVSGIEQAMESDLSGWTGWTVKQRDALNRSFSSVDYPVDEARDGRNVMLTIDQVYQSIVEDELRHGLAAHNAKTAMAVLMDPFSGNVLAMASISRNDGRGDVTQNPVIQTSFEPGSTLKVVAAAAALETGACDPETRINCENGAYHYAGRVIHDGDKAYGTLTFTDVLKNSSNIGMAKVAQKLGKKTLYQFFQNFGFGSQSGISLPGETAGLLRPAHQWDAFSSVTMAYGQGIGVTTLQMATMISTVANGGKLVQPNVRAAVLDNNEREIQSFSGKPIRRVISEKTAETLTGLLENVVQNGTGKAASVAGIRIAGKTGTAQIAAPGGKGYLKGVNVSSFVGFWPVERPLFAMAIVLDEARQQTWGSQSAAPIFSRIVGRMVSLPNSPLYPGNRKVIDEKPFVFASAEKTEPADAASPILPKKREDLRRVPKVTGLSLREALQRLAVREIEAEVRGSGVVVSQSPSPGTPVRPDLVCRLQCRTNPSGGNP